MASTSQNARLNQLLAIGEANVDRAESQSDLLKEIQTFADFVGPLDFSFKVAWWFFAVGLIFVSSAAALYWFQDTYLIASFFYQLRVDPFLVAFATGLVGLGVAGGSLAWMSSTSDRLPALSSKIARLSSFYHNGLSYLGENPRQTLARLNAQFGDYKRGNYSRELVESIRGVFSGSLRNLAFEYHRLHYVDQRTEVTVVPDGKGGTKTVTRIVYDHYDRYSLVIDFPWVMGISVRSDGHSQNDYACSMDTASPDFNKSYCLTGRSEMQCAKFIRPSTVLHLIKLFDIVSRPNLEFAESGKLCMSFASSDLLSFGTKFSLHAPQQFYTEISEGVELPRLMSALRWAHSLSELHDDNFSSSPTTTTQEK
jgi:hypothetical protein